MQLSVERKHLSNILKMVAYQIEGFFAFGLSNGYKGCPEL